MNEIKKITSPVNIEKLQNEMIENLQEILSNKELLFETEIKETEELLKYIRNKRTFNQTDRFTKNTIIQRINDLSLNITHRNINDMESLKQLVKGIL